MAKPKFFEMTNIRRMVPPHWNVKLKGTADSQEYLFYSAYAKNFAYILQVSKSRNSVSVVREDITEDPETKEVYRAYKTLFQTTYTHRANGLKFIRRTLK